ATLLRELDRARQEERDVVAGQLASGRRTSRVWLAAGLLAVLVLAGGGLGGLMLWNRRQDAKHKTDLKAMEARVAGVSQQVNTNLWAAIEKGVSPAVVHIRCHYRIRVPNIVGTKEQAALTAGEVLLGGGVTGSGVLIRPGLVLTAKHVVEPWKVRFVDWEVFQ